MASLISKLKAIVMPGGGILDTDWLEHLPRHDYLAAQDIVVQRLREFAAPGLPRGRPALQALLAIDAQSRGNLAALVQQYAAAPTLTAEIDERLWHAVHDSYRALDGAYSVLLEHHNADPAASLLSRDTPQILLNLVDTLRRAARWHYMRYQAMPAGGWLRLHDLYRMAENLGCTQTLLHRYPGEPETSVMCCYVEALMLDTLNHTSMLKAEIEMVAQWIGHWCRCVELQADYDQARHLFFVDLDEDRGGRRLRHFQPSPGNRYWDTDRLVMQVERLAHYLQQDRLPDDLTLAAGVDYADCRLLAEHMLVEWSRHYYLRQRRREERSTVEKQAQVVHGILNICQHVKNVFYSRRWQPQYEELQGRPLPAEARRAARQEGEVVLAGDEAVQWRIRNESNHGFGAMVEAGMNLWLRPGKLVLLDYEMNPDMPALGVVRSVQQQEEDMRSVGIEVISHTPTWVRMKLLAHGRDAQEFLPTDIFLAFTLTAQGEPPFPALYLSGDEEKGTPATLLMPRAEFIDGGIFELRTDTHHGQARLGRVLEQRDDWVRVEVTLSAEQRAE